MLDSDQSKGKSKGTRTFCSFPVFKPIFIICQEKRKLDNKDMARFLANSFIPFKCLPFYIIIFSPPEEGIIFLYLYRRGTPML